MKIDEYEKFKLIVDSIGLKYIKHGKSFRVLEEVEMKLDICIKNKIKAALIEGASEGSAVDVKFSPEVLITARLPDLRMNMTPDVYNGLVNINQVIIAEGQEVHLQ
jgi:hypothetical protein